MNEPTLTRKQADELQEALERYVELRDAPSLDPEPQKRMTLGEKLEKLEREKAERPEGERPTPEEIQAKWKEKVQRGAPMLMKLQLATFIEPFIPKAKFGGSTSSDSAPHWRAPLESTSVRFRGRFRLSRATRMSTRTRWKTRNTSACIASKSQAT